MCQSERKREKERQSERERKNEHQLQHVFEHAENVCIGKACNEYLISAVISYRHDFQQQFL